MTKKKMDKNKNHNNVATFSERIEKKIQELLTKGNKKKQVAHLKPKSGKGL